MRANSQSRMSKRPVHRWLPQPARSDDVAGVAQHHTQQRHPNPAPIDAQRGELLPGAPFQRTTQSPRNPDGCGDTPNSFMMSKLGLISTDKSSFPV